MGRALRTGLWDYGQGHTVPNSWPPPGTSLPPVPTDGLAAPRQPSISTAAGVKRRWSAAHSGGSRQVGTSSACRRGNTCRPVFSMLRGVMFVRIPFCKWAMHTFPVRTPRVTLAGPSCKAALAVRPAAGRAAPPSGIPAGRSIAAASLATAAGPAAASAAFPPGGGRGSAPCSSQGGWAAPAAGGAGECAAWGGRVRCRQQCRRLRVAVSARRYALRRCRGCP